MKTKFSVIIAVFAMLASALLENYPFLIFWGFFLVTSKLNEIQEVLEKK